jgi:hypothetical protein
MINVETDTGMLKLLLDTGATCTAVRAPCLNSTSKFILVGHDFGTQSIFPIDLMPTADWDGLLGMNFLREHSLFIDYPNKVIYLDLQTDNLLEHAYQETP